MTTSSEPSGGGPFREGGGAPCPRCGLPMLAADATEPMHCSVNCGDWYPPTALGVLIDPRDLTGHAVNWWKHGTALSCPVCRKRMSIIGAETNSVERCDEHGMWVEASRRDKFLLGFGDAIKRQKQRSVVADRLAMLPPVEVADSEVDLHQRVATLERTVAELTATIEYLLERSLS